MAIFRERSGIFALKLKSSFNCVIILAFKFSIFVDSHGI